MPGRAFARAADIDYHPDSQSIRDVDQLAAGLAWRPVRGWSVRPALRWSHNASNVPTSDFSRLEAMLRVRYEPW